MGKTVPTEDYSHLTHIASRDELRLYELIPNVVWIFDLDRHGWWWGNAAAIEFWGLACVDDLINKDLSDDTQGARDRTKQTFDLAAKNGLTIDPWTTYPGGKPKTLHMMHRAVTVGPDRHRAIIAYINEDVNLGEAPENLLLVEAMRYTSVIVTTFTLDGEPVVENPAATEAYGSIDVEQLPEGLNAFTARFANPEEGKHCLERALAQKGGQWTYVMNTDAGERMHTLDIRMTRHPLNGDYLFMSAEYDVTELHEAQEELRHLAHYDALTGLPSLRLLQDSSQAILSQAQRNKQNVAVMFVDLDGFKSINDTWGHDAGDEVLKEVAERIEAALRESDQVVRIGGDEFAVLATGMDCRNSAGEVASKLIETLSQPFALSDGKTGHIGASIGIAFFPDHGQDMEALLKAADQAMYHAKKAGKGTHHFAEPICGD
ncbi:sensor domain-containing diguanylate cyclase [Magnetovibrio sp. PR-2]|uniref:sensor domain-containing diguanylate cyclase n=1 Tax=Magnetovibrio sp. PR-2 TaxID=3120356 RepID=UPI002FCE54A1